MSSSAWDDPPRWDGMTGEKECVFLPIEHSGNSFLLSFNMLTLRLLCSEDEDRHHRHEAAPASFSHLGSQRWGEMINIAYARWPASHRAGRMKGNR